MNSSYVIDSFIPQL